MAPKTVELRDLHVGLARLESKVDTFIDQMKISDNRHNELEGRTRKVEQRQFWFTGAGSLAGVLFGMIAAQFGIHPSK